MAKKVAYFVFADYAVLIRGGGFLWPKQCNFLVYFMFTVDGNFDTFTPMGVLILQEIILRDFICRGQ
jgi:hypothetical protein